MPEFTCPNCKSHSISIWQKVSLNATVPTACKSCGAMLTTSIFWNIVSFSPLLAFVCWSLTGPHLAVVEISTLVVAGCISMLLHTLVSPIQTKSASGMTS